LTKKGVFVEAICFKMAAKSINYYQKEKRLKFKVKVALLEIHSYNSWPIFGPTADKLIYYSFFR
jgi:hypothetical protein